MKDHNWHRGGYGVINTTQILMYSSNIGVSRLVDENYHKNPEKFVEGLYKLGLATPLNLDIPGAAKKPNIRKIIGLKQLWLGCLLDMRLKFPL